MRRTIFIVSASTVIFALPCTCRAQQGEIPDFSFEPRQRAAQRLFAPPTSDLPNTLQPREKPKQRDRWWERPEPNSDALVTPDEGEWMILIHSYSDEKRDSHARQLTSALRGHPYRLRAFIYNYGRKEAIEQEKRIEAFVKEQTAKYKRYKDALKYKMKGVNSKAWAAPKIRIRRVPIKLEAGVLVGAYRDQETAKKALDEIRKMQPLDPKKVKLYKMYWSGYASEEDKKNKNLSKQEAWVNLFQKAFVVRNPALPKQKRRRWNVNMKTLRHWNSAEPYSLLKCNKKITLAVKEFYTPTQVGDTGKGMLKGLGLAQSQHSEDPAAQSARNLAEMLKKMGFPAYVLHMERSSLVTVGGFNSVQDPRYRATKQRLDQLLSHQSYARLKLFPQAYPMEVPH